MLKLLSVLPMHCVNLGVSQVFYSLCYYWQGPDLVAHMVVPSCDKSMRQSRMHEAILPILKSYYYKQADLPKRVAEKLFLKKINRFDVAYIFPGISLKTLQRAKQIGKPVFLERVNCFTGSSKKIMDDAYIQLGLQPNHAIDDAMVQYEAGEIELADFLICPSEAVTNSFLSAGVPAQKLITTTEGWEPSLFPYLSESQPVEHQQHSKEFSVVFVGHNSIRKGLHILLNAWRKANIRGKLIIVGRIDPVISELYADVLSRSDVITLGNRPDYATNYLKADVFALPSLEEGSPLVAYEAMAHGLPILASPMGAGGIARDGLDGFVIPPDQEDQWVEALIKLSSDPALRHQMGESARKYAYHYTWDKVAVRRAKLMLAALNR
jgi:glycosyltransferase involved in cell wall biosynthesis